MKLTFSRPDERGGIVWVAAASLLWLWSLGGIAKLPAACLIFAAAVLLLRAAGGKFERSGKIFRAAFYILIIAIGAAGAAALSGQMGRLVNAVSRAAAVKYDVIFPLAEDGGSAAACCFLAAAVAWAVCAAGECGSAAVRFGAGAAMLLPLILLCSRPIYIAAGAVAAVMTAIPPNEKRVRSTAIILPAAAAVTAVAAALPAESLSARLAREIFDDESGIVQPCGRVSEIDQPSGEAPALEVLMDSPEAVYLHGFTGCEYSDGSWLPPRTEELSLDYEQLAALADREFTADSQPMAAVEYGGAVQEKVQNVSVRRLGADGRYYYLTNAARFAVGRFPVGLENPAGFFKGSEVAEFSSLCNYFAAADNADEITAAAMRSQSYRAGAAALDKLYRGRGGYLQLPEESARVLEARLGEVGEVTAAEAAAIVGELLGGCEYDKNAPAQSAESFLQSTRRGNSCAYASAAVLALRYCGIPARYAEGYALTFSAAEGASGGSAITLCADDFHAWAEYYAEGFGWIPLETVEEYFDKMPQPATASAALRDSAAAVGGAGAQDRASERIYRRMEDDKKNGGEGKAILWWTIPAAAVVFILIFAIAFAAKLRCDPFFALDKCAKLLRVGCDEGGRRDFGIVRDDDLRERLDALQEYCLEKFYSRGKISETKPHIDGVSVFAACMRAGKRKRFK